MAVPFVWMGTMGTAVMVRQIGQLEGTLGAGADDEVRERFLRQAGRGLDRAYRLAGLLLADAAEAEDATQDALERAWRSLDSLRDPAAFEGWFDRILVNACRDRLRRRSKVRFIPIEGELPSAVTADPFRSTLDRDEALRALDVLDPDEREVVVMHYWADLPLAEVAGRTGRPIGTVKSRLHRALGKLGRAMDGATAPGTHAPGGRR